MTKIKIEIKTIGGSVLFSFEKESNTIKETVVEAVKKGAYLRGAYLRGADLRGAYLRGADLEGADLRGAYLRGSKEEQIPKSWMNLCSRDMLFVFEHLKHELPYLREKLVNGQVNGSQYEGECACLIGSLGKGNKECVDKVAKAIPFYEMGLQNPGEQWFWNINEGDTPENSFFVKHAVNLIDSVLGSGK